MGYGVIVVEAYINLHRNDSMEELQEALLTHSEYKILASLRQSGKIEVIVDEMPEDIQTRFRGKVEDVCRLVKANRGRGVFLITCDSEQEAIYATDTLRGYTDIDIEVAEWQLEGVE